MHIRWYHVKCIKQELVAKIRIFSLPENIKYVEEIIKKVGEEPFNDSKELEKAIVNRLSNNFYASTNIIKEPFPEYLKIIL